MNPEQELRLPYVHVSGINLSFKRGFRVSERKFKSYLINLLKTGEFGFGGFEPVHALKDISISGKAGEVVGIIGENGAGKTTLLKILAGLMVPDNGLVERHGTVSSIFGLGAGFIAHLSGRENVRLMGALYGFSEEDVEEMLPEVIEFSELKNAIDRPIRTYSSGMRARLGFSILCFLKTDIVILDEALSAGDIKFRKKVGNLIERFAHDKRLLFVVSHTQEVIEKYCTRAYYLSQGEIVREGTSKDMWKLFAGK